MLSEATPGDIYETLRDLEFCPHWDLTDIFDYGCVRVRVPDDECFDESITLMEFTGRNGHGGLLYRVDFSWDVPLEIVTAAIRIAVDNQS